MGLKTLKVISFVGTVVSHGLSMVLSVVSDKKLDCTISDKVAKEVSKQIKK